MLMVDGHSTINLQQSTFQTQMRIRGAKQVHYDSGPNMTPLVDVVMVILIFLMLAGSFGGAEHYLLSTTPLTKGGVGNNKGDLVPDDTTFMITVESPSPDRFIAIAGDFRATELPTLLAGLQRKLQQYEA